MTQSPRSNAGLIFSRTSWLRLASNKSSSVSAVIPLLWGANWSNSRIVSPLGVPPGSRVTRKRIPSDSSRAVSRFTCVDFPQPSVPSKVMNGIRGMTMSILKQSGTVVESDNEFNFGDETFLAREVGAFFLLVEKSHH